jgi:hypothetical protein
MSGYVSMTAALALLFATVAPAVAQTSAFPGAAANVRESELYDQLLRTDPKFRAQRMKIECGPINDPQLHQQCIASFGADGPPPSKRRQQ